MVNSKKAISPVVATALLLVVAVVAVVGFQTWFSTYQSGVNAQVEQQSASGSPITVERLQVNGDLFLKNTHTADINFSNINVTLADGTGACGDYGNGAVDASDVTVLSPTAACSLTDGDTYEIVIVTSDGVFQETELAR